MGQAVVKGLSEPLETFEVVAARAVTPRVLGATPA
jgi:hypothetical protein